MEISNLENLLDAILGSMGPMRNLIGYNIIGQISESAIREIVGISVPSVWSEVAIRSLLDAKSRINSLANKKVKIDQACAHESPSDAKSHATGELRSIGCEGKHPPDEHTKPLENIFELTVNTEKKKTLLVSDQELVSVSCEGKNCVSACVKIVENNELGSSNAPQSEKITAPPLGSDEKKQVHFSSNAPQSEKITVPPLGSDEKKQVHFSAQQISTENKEEDIIRSEYRNLIMSIAEFDNRNPIAGLHWVDFVKMSSENVTEFKSCCEKLPMGHRLALLRIFSNSHAGETSPTPEKR